MCSGNLLFQLLERGAPAPRSHSYELELVVPRGWRAFILLDINWYYLSIYIIR